MYLLIKRVGRREERGRGDAETEIRNWWMLNMVFPLFISVSPDIPSVTFSL